MEAGACSAEICKVNSDIVQLRLDFTSFVLSNPATGVATSFALLNGQQHLAGAGVFYTINGQCNEDSFTVSSPGSVGSPEICGVNTGDHSKLFCVFPMPSHFSELPLRRLKVAILKLPLPLPLLQTAIMEISAILKA